MEETKKINYKSDFDFIAKLTATNANGESVEVGFPDYDFELIITSGCNGYSTRSFVASSIGGVTKNCFNDNGQLHIVCDNHKLNVGELFGEFKAYLPNDIYPDGTQLNVEPQSLGIELVVGASDTPTTAEIELQLPYIYQSAYDLAVASGYEGSMEDYMRLSAELPEAVETAKLVKLSADSLANSAETISGAIETLATTTDAIEQGASTIASSATKVETSVVTLEGVSATISGSATSLAESANTIKNSADALQENANKVEASASAVEQAVEPLVQASESLNATKQAFEMLSSEWADGRRAIATALTNRRYPTEPTESFHAMADKITNMSYEEGWFAKIGYTDENDGGIKEAIDYAYELAKVWNPDGGTESIFKSNRNLIFAPYVDLSNCLNCQSLFAGCTNLVASAIAPKIATNISRMYENDSKLQTVTILEQNTPADATATFSNCSSLRKVKGDLKVTVFYQTFHSCSSLTHLDSIDIENATRIQGPFGSSALVRVTIKGIGKSTLTTYDFSGATVWGTGGEENRQSLIDSLITYSYDRASNGMATATIKLSATTKALLTEEEIAQITNKGFTIA